MRTISSIALALLVASNALGAQSADSLVSHGDKTFLVKRDLVTGGIALGATALLSIWDNDIAIESQKDTSHHTFADRASKVQETTLTVGGLVVYGVARLAHAETVADIALHATESVVLASVASQLIRGPLGRARPYVTHDSDQYSFHAFQGFGNFKYRSFPSIHTSSSMAVATVLTMETKRRHPKAAPYVAVLAYGAGILPGLARIELDQHWASDILSGAFMGVFAGYKVTKYSHDHPDNWFDRKLLKVSMSQAPDGRFMLGFNPF